MSFLSKFKDKLTPKLYGYYPEKLSPVAPGIIDHVAEGRFDEAAQLFYQQSRDERVYVVEAISDMVTQDDFYDVWYDDGSGPPLAALLRGALLTQRAWEYRGWGRAHEVSDESFDKMGATLQAAHDSLMPVVKDPELGQEAAAKLIRVLMGLSADWFHIDDMLRALRAHPVPHFAGELNYLIASCEKWLGSHEKMHTFAEETAEYYAEFPEIGGLVAIAHWERLLYLQNFDEDEAAAAEYEGDEGVRHAVKVRSQRLRKHASNKDARAIMAHNAFAAYFSTVDEYDLAQPHFTAIKRRVCRYPWNFYDPSFINAAYSLAML